MKNWFIKESELLRCLFLQLKKSENPWLRPKIKEKDFSEEEKKQLYVHERFVKSYRYSTFTNLFVLDFLPHRKKKSKYNMKQTPNIIL